jgi:Co/Zn/Cd efflux system component
VLCQQQHRNPVASTVSYGSHGHSHHHEVEGHSSAINMVSAVTHILSDFLRSTTTLVASLLIWVGGWKITKVDAFSALFVYRVIMVGMLGAIFVWLKNFHLFLKIKLSNYGDVTAPIIGSEHSNIQ